MKTEAGRANWRTAAAGLALAVLLLAGGTARMAARPDASVGNSPDDQAIQAVVAGMSAGWNAHDAHAMCAGLADNVEWLNWRGNITYGREKVEEGHAEEFKGIYKNTHRVDTVKNIHYLTPELASVDDFWTMTGAKTREGEDWPYRAGYVNYLMAKRNGRWTIIVSHTADFNAKAPASGK